MRYPARAASRAGVALAQFGEFGFVLPLLGQSEGLVTGIETSLIVTAGMMSMLFSRVAIALAPRMHAGEMMLRPLERLMRVRGIDEARPEDRGLSGHVVVVGYGVAGRVLSRALRSTGARYLVLELAADRVRDARARGEPAYYGDIASVEAMHHAGVPRARALVLLINDFDAVRRAISTARLLCPETPILVRTRYVRDRPELRRLGADQVICEELGAGAEVAEHVLSALSLPRQRVASELASALRADYREDVADTAPAWFVAVAAAGDEEPDPVEPDPPLWPSADASEAR